MKTIAITIFFGLMSVTPVLAQTECRSFFLSDATLFSEPQDTKMALFEPDCYAWRLFVALNWPAGGDRCTPDTSRKLGDDGETVWERWISKRNVFLDGAAEPAPWDSHCSTPMTSKSLEPSAQFAAARTQLEDLTGGVVMLEPPTGDVSIAADEEVRMNRDALEFISDNRLYSLDEQTRLAAAGVTTIDFPPNAKEVKAHWIKLDDPADHDRYHTGVDTDGTVYGLLAWHVTTKDLPRWFWATFEHVDNETRWPAEHSFAFAGWADVPPIDRFACEGEASDCRKIPAGIGLEDTKWENYVLKATQTDWIDSMGRATLVVNSKIEGSFIQTQSSCISCHALAMIGEGPVPMPFSIIRPEVTEPSGRVANFIGVVGEDDRQLRTSDVDPDWNFLQLDFVWSLRNAQREN